MRLLALRVMEALPTSCLCSLPAGLVNTSEMITHIYPLSRVQEAFDLRNDKSPECEAIHVLIDCQTGKEDIVRLNHASSGGTVRGPSVCC